MASATQDLRLPSQPQSITVLWPVPNDCLVTEAHRVCVCVCVCEPLVQGGYIKVERPGVEPTTS